MRENLEYLAQAFNEACIENDPVILESLIECGIDPDALTARGQYFVMSFSYEKETDEDVEDLREYVSGLGSRIAGMADEVDVALSGIQNTLSRLARLEEEIDSIKKGIDLD